MQRSIIIPNGSDQLITLFHTCMSRECPKSPGSRRTLPGISAGRARHLGDCKKARKGWARKRYAATRKGQRTRTSFFFAKGADETSAREICVVSSRSRCFEDSNSRRSRNHGWSPSPLTTRKSGGTLGNGHEKGRKGAIINAQNK